MSAIVRLAICLLLGKGTLSYSTGPPESACTDATPHHRPHVPHNESVQCPYFVDFRPFTPGVQHFLNITSWSGNVTFKGYQLTVFDSDSMAVGTFGESERTICQGAAATHNESSNKLISEVMWTPPVNSSGQLFYIWLTVVQNYSSFWVNCDSVILPAEDAPELLSQTSTSSTSSTSSSTSYSTTPTTGTQAKGRETSSNSKPTTHKPRSRHQTTTAVHKKKTTTTKKHHHHEQHGKHDKIADTQYSASANSLQMCLYLLPCSALLLLGFTFLL